MCVWEQRERIQDEEQTHLLGADVLLLVADVLLLRADVLLGADVLLLSSDVLLLGADVLLLLSGQMTGAPCSSLRL